MEAICVPCFGDVEVLEYINTAEPLADEILIRVEAAEAHRCMEIRQSFGKITLLAESSGV